MRVIKFIGLTVLIFILIGPMVPLLFLAVGVSGPDASFGDDVWTDWAEYVPVVFIVGGITGFGYGLVFAICTCLIARFAPGWLPAGASRMALAGAALGAAPAVVLTVSTLVAGWSALSWSTLGAVVLTKGMFDVLPSAVCGAVAAAWLLPGLRTAFAPPPRLCGSGDTQGRRDAGRHP